MGNIAHAIEIDSAGKQRLVTIEIWNATAHPLFYYSPSQRVFHSVALGASEFKNLGNILVGASQKCPVNLTVACNTGRIERISPVCKAVVQ